MRHIKMAKPTGNTAYYEIRVQGQLNARWADWFDGMTITLDNNGDTLLSGPVVDQAALHGLLKKVRDVGLTLLSVNSVNPEDTECPET
jgi:hypothetical protein